MEAIANEYNTATAQDITELWGDERPVAAFSEATGLPYRTVTGYITRGYFPIKCWQAIIRAARRDKKKVLQQKGPGKVSKVPITPEVLYSIWLNWNS